MLAESRSLRRKLVRHPADAGGYCSISPAIPSPVKISQVIDYTASG
jgi:hypothetical protein